MGNLTQQIAGAYIGAQVIWRGIEVPAYNVINAHEIINCHLILTPLSAISDEDSVEVARIMGIKEGNVIAKVKIYLTEGEFYWCDMGDKDGRNTATHIIDYLRSRNYDLGYMGIRSLIDAGIAISSTDKTETHVQP